ncbi:MAG: hypothetical protein ACE5GG_02555 [Candidatus Omnitrophota bacterium]
MAEERMLNDDIFEKWLDNKSKEIVQKLDRERITSEEMMVLALRAQANHFHALDRELRNDMQNLREDMNYLRQDMNCRFEQVDKRFERMYSLYEVAGGYRFYYGPCGVG